MKMLATKRGARFLGMMVGMVILLLSIGVALAAGETISRDLVGSGGGHLSTGGLSLQSAMGQPVTGAVENGIILGSGYLTGPGAPSVSGPAEPDYAVYLPLVKR